MIVYITHEIHLHRCQWLLDDGTAKARKDVRLNNNGLQTYSRISFMTRVDHCENYFPTHL